MLLKAIGSWGVFFFCMSGTVRCFLTFGDVLWWQVLRHFSGICPVHIVVYFKIKIMSSIQRLCLAHGFKNDYSGSKRTAWGSEWWTGWFRGYLVKLFQLQRLDRRSRLKIMTTSNLLWTVNKAVVVYKGLTETLRKFTTLTQDKWWPQLRHPAWCKEKEWKSEKVRHLLKL